MNESGTVVEAATKGACSSPIFEIARRLRGCLVLAALIANGCSMSRDAQLEAVAKDWCLTIRASQVVPVYPLTEDLEPGDVFLVQRTVDDQAKAYKEKGFLAFENHIARLEPSGYQHIYQDSFFKAGEVGQIMPREWLAPGEQTSFGRAPGAAFPAYTFSVSSGAGFTAALPIQGVPVGLSLLNTSSATGSVTIKDARTYGLDIMSVLADVQHWETEENTKSFLRAYAPSRLDSGSAPQNYIRVVHRVFLTGKLNVSLNSSQALSGGASVGVPKPVDLPLLNPPDATTTGAAQKASADGYTKGLASINESLNAAVKVGGETLPGASLRVVSASARSVSIDETFGRPVVIGYLGFDMAILPGGDLGPPIPTHAVLERGALPDFSRVAPQLSAAQTMRAIGTYRALDALVALKGPDAAKAGEYKTRIDDAARSTLPTAYPVPIWSVDPRGHLVEQVNRQTAIDSKIDPYRTLVTYLDQLRGSAKVLRASSAGDSTQQPDLTATLQEIDRVETRANTVAKPLGEADAWLNL